MVEMISFVVARAAVLMGVGVEEFGGGGSPRWKASSGGWEGGRVTV